jgi:hypothetical protein
LTNSPQWGTIGKFLLEIFAKNEKSNLTAGERNALGKIAAEIKHQLQGAKS